MNTQTAYVAYLERKVKNLTKELNARIGSEKEKEKIIEELLNDK